ncbi:hypothetical protein SASPL_153949 [Salvia splendens]|uniref:Uncharacterized protein n=1 Tax=Salvia splendens TaxID=180675 RepID=A0A8X8YY65_SALSN|nr:serine/arginine repetitive matrix protein 1-like [Salvia splendens]KAG6385121.1 hypothetical protein SASPL_153949 [Salvia splendens]
MGCCLSAGSRNREAENRRSMDGEPPMTPRAILEVETVKEVLLETPVALKSDGEKLKPRSPENQESPAEFRQAAATAGSRDAPGNDAGDTASEITELSEIGNYSESLSAAAAGDEDGVVDQRPPPRKRRATGGGRGRRERVVGRRVAAPPPPEKRGPVAPVRAVRGRTVAAPPRKVAEGNGNGNENLNGKNVEEGYGRSPVREKEVGPPPPPRKESEEKTLAAEGEAETLENPVVSLECFIFL